MLNNKIEIIKIIDAFIIIFFEARLKFDIPQFFQAANYISRMEKHTQKQQLFHVSKGDEPFFFFNSLFPQFTQWKLASSIRVGVYHEAGFARTQAVSLLVVLLAGDL